MQWTVKKLNNVDQTHPELANGLANIGLGNFAIELRHGGRCFLHLSLVSYSTVLLEM